MDISGNTIFIPGATSGIGLALALALRDRGNTVIIGGRRAQLLDEIAAANPGLDTVTIDTADPASITAAADRVLAKHPDLNVLVTMAGVMRIEDWRSPDTFLASAEEVVTTNVLGPIRLIAAFVEHLRQRGNATIVTVSSGLAFVPLRVTPSYNASKAAVHMLSESIRLNLAGTGVRVLELVPPAVRTELLPGHESNETGHAAGRVRGRGDDAAGVAAGRDGDPGRAGEVPPPRGGARRLRQGRRHGERDRSARVHPLISIDTYL
ncbi:SDR family oxidoreductase [Micromonospora sp. C32]|uniref:SDR family oxidoreductase n=1 Tax=Micromonospora sp. C32 TaxID=2824877 RepID=UPI001FFCBE18|nr:SDR family NAD(P)-dependent oxidoreductase [Micromonospora sp. C32]